MAETVKVQIRVEDLENTVLNGGARLGPTRIETQTCVNMCFIVCLCVCVCVCEHLCVHV